MTGDVVIHAVVGGLRLPVHVRCKSELRENAEANRRLEEQIKAHDAHRGHELPVSLMVPGTPRTKKNSGRIIRRGNTPSILPSKAFEAWAKRAVPAIEDQLREIEQRPIAEPLNCRAIFYRDALRGDAVGFYQALADILQEAGAVVDDKWIVSWDGSRLAKDAKNPRVEVVLTRADP